MGTSMKTELYYAKYLNRGQRSVVWRLGNAHHLISEDGLISGKDVWELQIHPPFDRFHDCRILKIDITSKKTVYALIGKVLCNFFDGQADVWFEIAVSQSKEKLGIWKDLYLLQ